MMEVVALAVAFVLGAVLGGLAVWANSHDWHNAWKASRQMLKHEREMKAVFRSHAVIATGRNLELRAQLDKVHSTRDPKTGRYVKK